MQLSTKAKLQETKHMKLTNIKSLFTRKRSCHLFLLSLLFCIILAPNALKSNADITYNPLYLIIYAPNGNGFASMNITNPTNSAIRMQLGTTDFELSDDLDVKILEKEPGKESITDFVKITPKQFTLGPQQKKVVRIACNLPANYEANKEYKLLFTMTEIGADRKLIPGPDSETGKVSYGLIINKAINAGTYIRTGQPTAFHFDLNLTDFSASMKGSEVEYKFNYQNTGNIHARQSIGIKFYDRSSGKLVGEKANVGGFMVFPNPNKTHKLDSSFTFPSEKLSNSGNYEIEFVIADDSLESVSSGKPRKTITSPKVILRKE